MIGANPWQSHGFPRARQVLQEIASDPRRTLVVIDPRRTETAERANVHLAVRPGGDAHLLLAMLGAIVQEGLWNREFIENRTVGFEEVAKELQSIPVDDYAREAGLDPQVVRAVARDYAKAERACVRTDLGLEHSPHSTLNTYLAKLLFLLTGHLGKPGTNVFHTSIAPLVRHSKDPDQGGRTTRVTGAAEIGGLYPPNVLPLEIDTDHPERIRAVVVESGNPLVTGADTRAYRDAFAKLELLVVIDVALTETARMAHYVLPAATQFEKYEATFFNLDFPANYFHLRRPLLQPAGQSLAEPEIHRRLVVALGALPARFPILSAVARRGSLCRRGCGCFRWRWLSRSSGDPSCAASAACAARDAGKGAAKWRLAPPRSSGGCARTLSAATAARQSSEPASRSALPGQPSAFRAHPDQPLGHVDQRPRVR